MLVSQLPDASLTELRDMWECEEEVAEVPECRDGCDLIQAKECITTLSKGLRHWGPSLGYVCRSEVLPSAGGLALCVLSQPAYFLGHSLLTSLAELQA